MAWAGRSLSMLTMIVPIFLIAVGTAYCMHIMAEYVRASAEPDSPAQAAADGISGVWFPTILAVLTTLVGLCSLLVNRIQAIREFAVFAGIGIVFLLIVMFTFVPAVLALFPAPSKAGSSDPGKGGLIKLLVDLIVRINLNHQGVSLLLIIMATLFSLYGITLIKVENNPVDYFRKSTSISRNFHEIYKDLSGGLPINIIVRGDSEKIFQNPEKLRELEKLQTFLAGLPGVDKTESFADYLKLTSYASNQFSAGFLLTARGAF